MNSGNEDLSVISIDMGLQNLAYAHFKVPADMALRVDSPAKPTPTLTAWEKLSILQMMDPATKMMPKTKMQRKPSRPEEKMDSGHLFGKLPPQAYAGMAYSIVDDLISKYRPTHVLIERQRLRTKGSPWVFETVLNVSMFESMLHAAFAAIMRERGLVGLDVQAINPKSVVSTLNAALAQVEGVDRSNGGAAAINDFRSKQMRVDMAGRFLGAWAGREGLGGVQDEGDLEEVEGPSGASLDVAADSELRVVAMAYLDRWQRSRSRRKRNAMGGSPTERKFVADSKKAGMEDVRKLDDLADCLIQGLVWLDWQVMRDLFCRQGMGALPWMRQAWVTEQLGDS